jgi:hypothetical protein
MSGKKWGICLLGGLPHELVFLKTLIWLDITVLLSRLMMSVLRFVLPGSQEMAEQREVRKSGYHCVNEHWGCEYAGKCEQEVQPWWRPPRLMWMQSFLTMANDTGRRVDTLRFDVVCLCQCDVVIWPVCCCRCWLCIGTICVACASNRQVFMLYF